MVNAEVENILKQYPVFEEGEYHKLHCKITGHDVPRKAQQLKEYIATKKFQTAFKIYEILEANPNVFEELDEENVIGCKITKTVIAKDPKDLEAHLNGKKFKKALERGVTGDDDEEEEMISDNSEMEDEDEKVEEEVSEESEEEPEPEPVSVKKGKKKAATTTTTKPVTKAPAKPDDYDFSTAMDTEEKPKKQLKRKGPEESAAKNKKKKKN